MACSFHCCGARAGNEWSEQVDGLLYAKARRIGGGVDVRLHIPNPYNARESNPTKAWRSCSCSTNESRCTPSLAMGASLSSFVQHVDMAEEEPLLITPIDTQKMTHADIEQAKHGLLEDHIECTDAGPVIKAQTRQPVTCQALRELYCFKVCVARNAHTPINELHLIQPLFLTSTLLGALFLMLGPVLRDTQLDNSAGVAVVLMCFSSLGLLVIGRIARAIPSLEDQVVELIDDERILEAGKTAEVDMANEAEDLQALTLELVNQTAKQRTMCKQMHSAFVDKEREFIRLRYKAKMMGLFWDAEQDLYVSMLRKRQRQLRSGVTGDAADQLLLQKPIPPPNGALNIHELRGVVAALKNRGDDIEILDDLINRVIVRRLMPMLAPEDTSKSFSVQREWSYSQLIVRLLCFFG